MAMITLATAETKVLRAPTMAEMMLPMMDAFLEDVSGRKLFSSVVHVVGRNWIRDRKVDHSR